jgi:hypothetical protein
MANGTYGTPMVSSVMPNPMGVTSAGMNKPASMSQPMTTTGLQAGTVRNMNLPLSRATPIQVNETTPNLEEIQNFPVAGRGLDGTHFHQDPVSGQMYVMTEEFHQRIPQILADRQLMSSDIFTDNGYGSTLTVIDTSSQPTITNQLGLSNDNKIFNVSVIPLNDTVIDLNKLSDYVEMTNGLSDVADYTNMDMGIYGGMSGQIIDTDNVNNRVSLEKDKNLSENITQISINRFPITQISKMGVFQTNYFIPINRFINTSNMSSDFGVSYEKYSPINKFQ